MGVPRINDFDALARGMGLCDIDSLYSPKCMFVYTAH